MNAEELSRARRGEGERAAIRAAVWALLDPRHVLASDELRLLISTPAGDLQRAILGAAMTSAEGRNHL